MAPGLGRTGWGPGLRTASTRSAPTRLFSPPFPASGARQVCPQPQSTRPPPNIIRGRQVPESLTGLGSGEQEGLLGLGRPSPAGSAGDCARRSRPPPGRGTPRLDSMWGEVSCIEVNKPELTGLLPNPALGAISHISRLPRLFAGQTPVFTAPGNQLKHLTLLAATQGRGGPFPRHTGQWPVRNVRGSLPAL